MSKPLICNMIPMDECDMGKVVRIGLFVNLITSVLRFGVLIRSIYQSLIFAT